jgi:hypothetical protein
MQNVILTPKGHKVLAVFGWTLLGMVAWSVIIGIPLYFWFLK